MKKQKKFDWKKDNLRHIADHGLSVQFTDARKTEFLRSQAGRDGEFVLTVGKSFVRVETVGRVSRVYYYSALGNGFHSFSVSYYSPEENLTFTEKGMKTREVLEHLVFGDFQDASQYHYTSPENVKRDAGHVPSILRVNNGADLDALRAWSKENAWALLAENGLRSKAVEHAIKSKRDTIASIENALGYGKRELENKRTFPFDKELEREKDYCKHRVATLDDKLATLARDLEQCKTLFSTEQSLYQYLQTTYSNSYAYGRDFTPPETALLNLGATINRRPVHVDTRNPSGTQYVNRVYFAGRVGTFSAPFVRANYKVSREENGKLRLSSGIVLPFSELDALAWLRGERPALRTQYGACGLLNTCREDGSPLVLVTCGCHKIDVAGDLGGEYLDLLKPKHKAEYLPAVPQLDLALETSAEFLARLESNYAENVRTLQVQRAETLQNYVQRKNGLITQRDTLPAILATAQAGIDKAQADKAQAETELETLKTKFRGVSLEKANELARKTLSAFSLPRL